MYRMISLHKCILTISLLIFVQSIAILCATVDPTPYYQRSNDGSYRYGYNAGGGFNARQKANAANEVVGQYAQLQPDGRIANVRYKAGVSGFRPQYGAASPAFSGAALGGSGALARQSLANGFYGTGSGPFGARSLSGGSPFGYGSLNTPGFSSDAAYSGGSPANGAFSGSGALGGGSFGAGPFGGGVAGGGSFGSGSLGGGPGGRSLGTGSEGGLQGGGGLGSGGLVGGSQRRVPFGAAGDRPLGNDGIGGTSGGSNLGPGYSGGPNGNGLGPGSFANRSPIGGSLGAGTIGGRSPTDGTFAPGSSTGPIGPLGSNAIGGLPQQRFGSGTPGSAYGGFPRYAPTSAFGSPFGYPQRVPLAFVYTTPRSFTTPATNRNSGPFGDGPHPSRSAIGDSRGVVPGTNAFQNDVGNHDQEYATRPNTGYRPNDRSLATPNGLPNQIASSTPTTGPQSSPRNDGTYNFAYRTPDSTRQESADGNGNVQGSYSFHNANGDHDLSFVAGPSTGFQPTGGSLAVPNGIGQRRPSLSSPTVSPTATTFATTTVRADGSNGRSNQVDPVSTQILQGGNGFGGRSGQDFGTTERGIVYSTNPDQVFSTTVRPLPAGGQNSNSFQNGATNGQGFNGDQSGNDQRFQSDRNNGFGQVGGNAGSGRRIGENQGPDGSYGFQQTNPGYGSFGAGGADGNLGSSSNSGPFNRGNGGLGGGFGSAGGGSLSNAYGRSGGGGSGSGSSYGTGTAHSNQGRDGSYDFSYDTGRQAHRESGDGSGRVDGRYSYLSDGRQQSLSYRVRPGTGFEVTGGNLASKTAIPK